MCPNFSIEKPYPHHSMASFWLGLKQDGIKRVWDRGALQTFKWGLILSYWWERFCGSFEINGICFSEILTFTDFSELRFPDTTLFWVTWVSEFWIQFISKIPNWMFVTPYMYPVWLNMNFPLWIKVKCKSLNWNHTHKNRDSYQIALVRKLSLGFLRYLHANILFFLIWLFNLQGATC